MKEYRTDIDGEEEWSDLGYQEMGIKERLHDLIHNEEYKHYPLPEELEEGGLVGGTLQEREEIELPRPTDLNPYEANQVRHWEQRRRMRRINNDGRRHL